MNEESNSAPEVLSINVHESLSAKAVFGPEDTPQKRQSIVDRIVPPHPKRAREVTVEDIPRVLEEAMILWRLCHVQTGMYKSAHAMAHSQIDDKDPLRFFVTVTGEVIINPVIMNTSKFPIDSVEGCMSYAGEDVKKIKRYNVVDLEFQSINEEKTALTERKVKTFSGTVSKVVQHETAHLNGKYVYDDDASPDDCLDKEKPSV